jgi:hypothetical protein
MCSNLYSSSVSGMLCIFIAMFCCSVGGGILGVAASCPTGPEWPLSVLSVYSLKCSVHLCDSNKTFIVDVTIVI